MKFLVLALCMAAVTAAPPSSAGDTAATILRSDNDVRPDGFSFGFETDNGISASSSGSLKKVDNVDAIAIQGSYNYVAPDGTPVNVQYIADENGFQPSSDVLPVGPAIPEAIQRSLDYIAAHPPPPETQKRL